LVRKAGKNGAVILTERDHELLVSLLKYRYLSTGQVQRLHFPSEQTATRRLRLLETAGFIATFKTMASADRLASLARRGAEVVAEQLAVPLESLGWDAKREQPKDYLFLKHFLAAADFRITLTQACAPRPDVRLLGFTPEHVVDGAAGADLKKHVRDVTTDAMDPRQKISHAPDAVFTLQREESSALFFLEIDRGTEVLSNPERGVLKTVRFYLSSLVTGSYQRYQAEFGVAQPFRAFRALFVVSSAERVQNIRQICGTCTFSPEHAKRFLWLTTDDALTDQDLLAREWLSLDPTDSRRYAILPSVASAPLPR
jgi:hypothetical protein